MRKRFKAGFVGDLRDIEALADQQPASMTDADLVHQVGQRFSGTGFKIAAESSLAHTGVRRYVFQPDMLLEMLHQVIMHLLHTLGFRHLIGIPVAHRRDRLLEMRMRQLVEESKKMHDFLKAR